jgi:hypothetical protein
MLVEDSALLFTFVLGESERSMCSRSGFGHNRQEEHRNVAYCTHSLLLTKHYG